jgi:DNA-binding FrmR family transcriptional regulator
MRYGYHQSKDKIAKRLSRIEGQVRGVSKMVQTDEYCIDILTQISAVQAALDKVALELLRDHTKHCLTSDDAQAHDGDDRAEELVKAVSRLLSR